MSVFFSFLCFIFILLPSGLICQDYNHHLRQAAVYDSLVQSFMGEDQFGDPINDLPPSSQDSIRFFAKKAIEECSAALAINPNIVHAYRMRGSLWYYLNKCEYLENEIADYAVALRLNDQAYPNDDCENYTEGDDSSYFLLENVCLQFGNPDSAWLACTRRLSVCPADYDYRRHRAFLSVLLNRYDDAISDIDSLFTTQLTHNRQLDERLYYMDTVETKPAVLCSRAFAKAMLGDTVGALQDFEQARLLGLNLFEFFKTASRSFLWSKYSWYVRLNQFPNTINCEVIGTGYVLSSEFNPSLLPELMANFYSVMSLETFSAQEYIYQALTHNLAGNTAEARRDLTAALALVRDAPQRIFIRAMLQGYFPE